MAPQTTQAILAAGLGCLVLVVVVILSRKKRLSFRYAVGWLSISILGIFSSYLVRFSESVSAALGLSPSGFFGVVAMSFLVIITIQLSVSISGLQRQNRKLAEELARMRLEITNVKSPKR